MGLIFELMILVTVGFGMFYTGAYVGSGGRYRLGDSLKVKSLEAFKRLSGAKKDEDAELFDMGEYKQATQQARSLETELKDDWTRDFNKLLGISVISDEDYYRQKAAIRSINGDLAKVAEDLKTKKKPVHKAANEWVTSNGYNPAYWVECECGWKDWHVSTGARTSMMRGHVRDAKIVDRLDKSAK